MQVNSGALRKSDLALNGGTPVRASWLPYGRQSISDSDIEAVVAALRSDWLTQGPAIEEFENAVAQYCGAKYAVAFCNGTAALHAAYFAAGIGAGDEVITSAMTFAATANACCYVGAIPIFADIEADTGLIDVDSVAQALTLRSRAIVGVDYAGQPCDVEELAKLASTRGIPLIIDGAHSLGASYRSMRVGVLGDMTMFSFHPVKSITTGEGGMIVTDNEDYFSKLRTFRTHGIVKDSTRFIGVNEGPWYQEMQCLGFNYRITDLQASLGLSQLQRLDEFIERRHQIAERYRCVFGDSPYFECLRQKPNRSSSNHLFPVLIKKGPAADYRKTVVEALHAENIGVQVHYIPVYRHPYYQRMFGSVVNCPNAEVFYSREISLPIFVGMSEQDIQQVQEALEKVAQCLFGD